MLDDIIQAQSMFRLMFQQAQKQLLSLRRLRPKCAQNTADYRSKGGSGSICLHEKD